MTAVERLRSVKGTAELKQSTYFSNVLTLKGSSEYALHWGRVYAFVSTGNKRLWIPSKLRETRFV